MANEEQRLSMHVEQETAPAGAAALRREIVPTELGPCAVRVQAGTGGAASGTADVYLHGAAGSWSTFIPLLRAPAAQDRVLVDLPGWGGSTTGARAENFSIQTMAQVVTGVLASLGYRRWNLVGHSMGGVLALHIAAAWPERTASVAAISATTFGVSAAARGPLRSLTTLPAFVGMLLVMRSMAALGPAGSALVRKIGATPLMRPLMSPFFADPAAVPAKVIRRLGEDARPASFAAAARAAAGYDFSQWRGIRCPVLATRGDKDVFTPPTDLLWLAELVPHVRTVTIPHCGHFAVLERPDLVEPLLNDLHAGWKSWPSSS
jgi:pimeloyl-ACP methyl ester carboxylesterase